MSPESGGNLQYSETVFAPMTQNALGSPGSAVYNQCRAHALRVNAALTPW